MIDDRYDYERARILITKVERKPEGVIWNFLQHAVFEGKKWDTDEDLNNEYKSLSHAERAAVLRGLSDHARYIVQHASNLSRALANSKGR